LKRLAIVIEELEDKVKLVIIRIMLLIKRANIKRKIESLVIEYLK